MANHLLQLDYQMKVRRGGKLSLLLLFIGMVSIVAVTLQYTTIQNQITSLSHQIETITLRDLSDNTRNKTITLESAGEVTSTNAVIAQLSLPWNTLFKALEDSRNSSIALLGIEPNMKTHTVRIFGETKKLPNISQYLKQLQKQDVFYDVILSEHELTVAEGNSHVRFTITASWKGM